MREQNVPDSVKACMGRMFVHTGVCMCGLRISVGVCACGCVARMDHPSSAPVNSLCPGPGPLAPSMNPAARCMVTVHTPFQRALESPVYTLALPLGEGRHSNVNRMGGTMGNSPPLLFKLIKFLSFYNEHSVVTINVIEGKKNLFLSTIFPFPLREQQGSHVSGDAVGLAAC